MFRVLFVIIYIVVRILNSQIRRDIWGNTSYLPDMNRTGLSDFVRLSLRRRSAFKQCRRFLTKRKNTYKLKNNYVTVVYDTENKVIKCFDKSIKKRTATIEWYMQNSFELNYIDNEFEETFDSICALFNERATYDGIVSTFKSQFKVDETCQNNEKEIENVNIPHTSGKMFNVNEASEQELTDLPGLSIVHAKKIIKYREKHDGFSSLDELFKTIKINSHFQEQLKYYLYVGSYIPQEEKSTENSLKKYNDFLILDDSEYETNERIIDI